MYFCLFVLQLKPILFNNCVQYIRVCVCVCVFDTCLYSVTKFTCLSVCSFYGYWATGWTTRVLNPGRSKAFVLFSKNAHTDSVAHVASCSMGTRVSFLGVKGPESEVDHSHYIVPMLRMSGCMPLLPLHAFTVCTDTILLLMYDVSFFYFVTFQWWFLGRTFKRQCTFGEFCVHYQLVSNDCWLLQLVFSSARRVPFDGHIHVVAFWMSPYKFGLNKWNQIFNCSV